MQSDFDWGGIFAFPITSGAFTFSSRGFEVDCYPRCDSKHLYNLLTFIDHGPLLTKAGKLRKRQPLPHRDKTAEFYEAQLVHYGLERLKTRDVAKKALLVAFKANGRKLLVPREIQDLEQELKVRFADSNRQGRQKYEEERAYQQQQQQQQQRQLKRKREADPPMAEVLKGTKQAKHDEVCCPTHRRYRGTNC